MTPKGGVFEVKNLHPILAMILASGTPKRWCPDDISRFMAWTS